MPNPLAGQPAPRELLTNISRWVCRIRKAPLSSERGAGLSLPQDGSYGITGTLLGSDIKHHLVEVNHQTKQVQVQRPKSFLSLPFRTSRLQCKPKRSHFYEI